MALTVEDGTGLAAADSYVTLAACDTYHTDRGNSTWTGTDAVKEAAIRRATQWVDTYFAWKGRRVHGRDQALEWPRAWVTDRGGWDIDNDEIPVELVNAVCEAALRELVMPGFFTPDVIVTDRVKRERVGPIEVEYADVPAQASATRPVVLAISDILRGLTAGGMSGFVGTAVRA